MLTGSYASSMQGEPRLTHDIDLVVAITLAAARSLLVEFPSPDYYLDENAISDAIGAKVSLIFLISATGTKSTFGY